MAKKPIKPVKPVKKVVNHLATPESRRRFVQGYLRGMMLAKMARGG